MSPLRLLLLLILTIISLIPTALSTTPSTSDLIAELESLRSNPPSGVIHFDDAMISRFLTSIPTPRPYSIIIFFDAKSLHSKPDLHLPQLRSEFSLLSSSFQSHNSKDTKKNSAPLFFAALEFPDSQASFGAFAVNSLPHVRLVRPHDAALKDSISMDQSHFSRLAESMSEFVEAQTGLQVGPIVRPPPISQRQVIILFTLFLISLPFVIKRILVGDTLFHDKRVWMAGAVFVYFFSVSGAMYGIIRHTPMFTTDRADPNKLVFFYQGSGMQLGAEGFAVGFLYTIVGLMIAGVMYGLVRVQNVAAQRIVMLVVMAVSYWAVRKVIHLDNWKTGYGIHTFWPNSWRR